MGALLLPCSHMLRTVLVLDSELLVRDRAVTLVHVVGQAVLDLREMHELSTGRCMEATANQLC